MENRTTIKLKGKEFPLFDTKRGAFDFYGSGNTVKAIQEENPAALMAYIFFYARACAWRENMNWPYPTLDAFVDDDEIEMLDISKAFIRLRLGEDATATLDEAKEAELGEAMPDPSTSSGSGTATN